MIFETCDLLRELFHSGKGSVMSIECGVVSEEPSFIFGRSVLYRSSRIEGDIGILKTNEPFMTYLKDGVIWGVLTALMKVF